ncbi:phosphoribosylaminoimidazolesuccinocarboxamide synthase [Gammaproteobacteria bacterium]|nr:phosphoribosylaminoimidazolesuccinocarboxamide synthase [Gammaproteobacteria bacterium]
MQRREHLYAGKAKSVYSTDDPDRLILLFRDDTSAFDGERMESLPNKGKINNYFNAFIMDYLAGEGFGHHFVERLSDTESLVLRLDMLPVECVVRNVVAGSLAKRLGRKEGELLAEPMNEFFLKNDALHDPMINDDHMRLFGWATVEEIRDMREIGFAVNQALLRLFDEANIDLIDFKLEFGRYDGQLVLGDEFTPDGCRLWDKTSAEKLDKDRFRRNLGGVVEAYLEVADRLGLRIE